MFQPATWSSSGRLNTFFVTQQPLIGHGLLVIVASRSHSDTSEPVGFLWTSDQPDEENSTRQYTTLATGRNPSPQRDSNPQSKERGSGRRPTPLTARPLGLAVEIYKT